jgi:uncharacterized protein YeaO (DUF488 family)
MIRVKRVYDPPKPGDGDRFLADHLCRKGRNERRYARTAG